MEVSSYSKSSSSSSETETVGRAMARFVCVRGREVYVCVVSCMANECMDG